MLLYKRVTNFFLAHLYREWIIFSYKLVSAVVTICKKISMYDRVNGFLHGHCTLGFVLQFAFHYINPALAATPSKPLLLHPPPLHRPITLLGLYYTEFCKIFTVSFAVKCNGKHTVQIRRQIWTYLQFCYNFLLKI